MALHPQAAPLQLSRLLLRRPLPREASGQKTAKACQEEWRANKVANQANGVTEKAYVATCRGGAAPTGAAVPAAPPSATPAATAAAPGTAAGQKTAKECREEWRANKAANQANGVTEKAYVAACRGGAAPAATAAPAAPAPTAAPTAPAPTAAAPPTEQSPPPTAAARPAPTASANPVGANQFSTEAQAKARCPTDTVVWANLRSKIYHFSGNKNYGNTKSGAYMCSAIPPQRASGPQKMRRIRRHSAAPMEALRVGDGRPLLSRCADAPPTCTAGTAQPCTRRNQR